MGIQNFVKMADFGGWRPPKNPPDGRLSYMVRKGIDQGNIFSKKVKNFPLKIVHRKQMGTAPLFFTKQKRK
jgi:hypothetical protein